ncbi:MAG: PadR family transcriptional regulator [Ruminococcus sp.]|uniref:Transcriptional regulator PadR-like family n=1 Tax=Siphoviridae sp. ctj8j9 TaxID=2825629 RepID=A0A8S5TSK4_9CAUD|nr:PadR family transcriptional regulator [Ruminococcus sp.]CDE30972.1 transcriptional regulator PadR-like family [Ruminococcus sp. CAG:403]DAF85185.1 MAG TPA: Transcriptional regulator PadR-like family [Siphoviridae sp. ctj8j9]
MSAFPISAALLDAMVLALVQKEDTYGYKITREIQAVISISESTLYPVLRRLQKEQFLVTYDRAYLGRNRRYYQITEAGRQALSQYRTDWNQYKQQIDSFLKEETT